MALALPLAACSTGPHVAGSASEPPANDAPAAPAPGPAEPDRAPRPDPVPDTAPPGECDPATRTAIEQTVATQLAAFATRDFAAAYAMTSAAFRLAFTVDDFETLIRADYAVLLGNDGQRFDECLIVTGQAFLVVGVRTGHPETGRPETGGREVVMRYDLSEEPDGWRIDGAGLLPGITLPPERLV